MPKGCGTGTLESLQKHKIKPKGEESCIHAVAIKLPDSLLKIKDIPQWQDKLRMAISNIIEEELG